MDLAAILYVSEQNAPSRPFIVSVPDVSIEELPAELEAHFADLVEVDRAGVTVKREHTWGDFCVSSEDDSTVMFVSLSWTDKMQLGVHSDQPW